jgi:Ca2+-binding RTX toxin-like protein
MKLCVQQLEPRENPTASVVDGDLIIIGTAFTDSVVVEAGPALNQVRLTENGVVTLFTVSGGVVFRGFAGNDLFINETALKVTAFGGSGNDVLIGGGGRDTLFGGKGNDDLVGRGLGDFLFGGAGADALSGGYGHDWLDGGADSDRIRSGPGRDRYVADFLSSDVLNDFDPRFDTIV